MKREQKIKMMDVKKLVEEYRLYLSGKTMKRPHHFNVLDALQGSVVENSHSNILMQLLNYCEQGRYVFLESLLQNQFGFNLTLTGSVRFECEKAYGSGRLDGLIYGVDRFAIIIENKVNGAKLGANQLGRYIEAVSCDNNIFTDGVSHPERVWVVYLTRDGDDPEDQQSIEAMARVGIIDAPVAGELITGKRYVSASYREHILPWLEQDVYPMIRNNDHEMSSGVMQYICYLKGENFFDMSGLPLDDDLRWFKNHVSLPDDPIKSNQALHQLYLNVSKDGGSSMEANRLLNVIQAVALKPMTAFMEVTRNHFSNCDLCHHFTFYYINMRPTKQISARAKVVFCWSLLGIKRLTATTPQDYVFCIHVSGTQEVRDEFVRRYGLRLNAMGYEIEEKITRMLVYRSHVQVNAGILTMDDAQQREWLNNIYHELAPKDLVHELVDGSTGNVTSGYESIRVERINAYQKAMAAIYNQGQEKYSLRLAASFDGIVLNTPGGEITLAPSENNVGRPVLELHGITAKQRDALTRGNIAQEWFIQTHDHLNNCEHRITAFGIEVQKNIHLPAEQLLHNTVQNVFKAFDVLKALS